MTGLTETSLHSRSGLNKLSMRIRKQDNCKLPVFTKRAKRAMTAQPKFYLFDAGVYYHAVEVKNAKQIHPRSLTSLKVFLQDYPEADATLLYRGAEKLKVDGILCWPVEDFLCQLKPNQWP